MTSTDSNDVFGIVPAAAVISACLTAQASVPPRSSLARFLGRSPLSEDSRPWYLGALGELRVAERLAMLGPEWTVLHSVPIGDRGSDIDHVVISASGVFTINTKFHEDARVWVGSKRLLVNGQKTDHLRNSRYEAQRVSKQLTAAVNRPLDVHAAIVLVGLRSITIREQPSDVAVLRETELLRWLKRRPDTMDVQTRLRVAEIVSRRDTWATSPAPLAETDVAGFHALRSEVVAARRVRLLWGTTLLLCGVVVVGTIAVSAYSALLGG